MATALKLKTDIKKFEAAIKSKATPKEYIPKLKAQLEKAKNELERVQSSSKPTKPSASVSNANTSTLKKLQDLIKKNKKYADYRGSKVDLKKDAGEGAFAKGRRVSKGLKSNQFGTAKENKGNVYYEYRVNRLDVKQPRKKQTYPKLAEGGYMADGGKLAAGVYRVGKPTKVSPMLYEQKIVEIFENGDISTASDYGRKLSDFKYQKYPIITREKLEEQYKMASGGMMAKGGKIKVGSTIMYEGKKAKVLSKKGDMYFIKVENYYPNGDTLHQVVRESEVYKMASGGMMANGGILEVGDKVIFKDNKYVVSKITNENKGGFTDTKWHLDSSKIGVKDVVLDSPKGVTKISDSEYMANSGIMAKGGGIGEIYTKMYRDTHQEKQFNKRIDKKRELDNYATKNKITIDNNNIIYVDGEKIGYINKINQKTGQQKTNWDFVKFADGGEVEEEQKVIRGYSDDEPYEYAKGGAISHGLKMGDKIVADQFWENSIVVDNPKTGRAVVYLETGKRVEGGKMSHGGELHRTQQK